MTNTIIALVVPVLLLLSAIFILLFGFSAYYSKNRGYYITLVTLFITFVSLCLV